eukprot:2056902-Rhodomonas_salina.3
MARRTACASSRFKRIVCNVLPFASGEPVKSSISSMLGKRVCESDKSVCLLPKLGDTHMSGEFARHRDELRGTDPRNCTLVNVPNLPKKLLMSSAVIEASTPEISKVDPS